MLADVYLRISDDREGLEVGVERQEEDCRALAASMGLTVRRVYRENDVGASSLSRKPRSLYRAMIESVRKGEVKTVLAYSNSRLTRRPMELEEWIGLHAETGVQIHTVVSGSDDLSTADGRMVARVKASVDAAEAERTGERVARAAKQAQSKGIPGGGPRPFGFKDDRISHEPAEARAIQWAATFILHGGTLADVVRRWNSEGFRTAKGNEWRPTSVRENLMSPRLKGVRGKWVHVKGKRGHWEPVLDAAGNEVKAQWEPILKPEEFDRLQEVFRNRKVKGNTGYTSRKYLLSPFLRCGECGSRMRVTKSHVKGGLVYCCYSRSQGGCGSVARTAHYVDEVVLNAVSRGLAAILSDVQPVPVSSYPDDRVSALEGLLRDALGAWKRGDLPSDEYFTLRAELTEEKRTLERERLDAETRKESTALKASALSRWESGTLSERQAILDTMLTAIIIDPLPVVDGKKVRKGTPDLIRIVWRED